MLPLEKSFASTSATSLTRTRTVVPIESGMVQEYALLLGVVAMISLGYVPPPSVEYSSLTLDTVPVLVHVMSCESPTTQTSEPLGAVSTNADRMAKTASDRSNTFAFAASDILTKTPVDMVSGMVQS